ncbi:LytTR family transcriptional regulator [Echinicola sp. CAU 1574]|uniref:LytTR family transcriptional regulator n=1 Tax=Echinicola arenosa TaxID=2774144 RepID=A0ABR9AFB0_9BACT|nr:LytTR family DNA-binding domain-containing protein [Echinicola arenosa]MBD8487300.1 LytTR family transcriptional regulator [Echinicola arenosa]
MKNRSMVNEECIYFKRGTEIIRTEYSKICYVQVKEYMVQIVMDEGEIISQWQSLKEFQLKLPDYFVKISRSKVVNWDKVVSIDKKSRNVKLIDGSEHQISFRKLQEIGRLI